MKQKHSQKKMNLKIAWVKHILLFTLLVASIIVLSGCYMEPDRIVDDNSGLTIGTGGQQFDTIITPTPAVTITPEPTIAIFRFIFFCE